MTSTASMSSDRPATFEALERHHSPPENAEIAFVVASANFIQRIGRNLDVELEK